MKIELNKSRYEVTYTCLICNNQMLRKWGEDENIPDFITCNECNSLAKLDGTMTGWQLKNFLRGGGINEKRKSGNV